VLPDFASVNWHEPGSEPLARLLDLSTWLPGENLDALYGRLRDEVALAVAQEERIYGTIRRAMLPQLLETVAAIEADLVAGPRR